METTLKCLCIRAPYAGQIVDGTKPIEFRSQPTRIRGRIGIIQSKSGSIIGECELYDCYERTDFKPGEVTLYTWCWAVRNPIRYAKPIPYKHKSGAVVWINVPTAQTGCLNSAALRDGTGTAEQKTTKTKRNTKTKRRR